eukprot:gnl/Chilomastix_caulleri/2770.p1 GENE.gnl/Chilomastix_caulleri/2770~~gnl/Chilomastix_caulleri/2770.p1  ORF type:complete len:58 (+),score=4.32 gnl/Chilomastix_caulleri/2770:31-204(+)
MPGTQKDPDQHEHRITRKVIYVLSVTWLISKYIIGFVIIVGTAMYIPYKFVMTSKKF